jgi:hypothetical protein
MGHIPTSDKRNRGALAVALFFGATRSGCRFSALPPPSPPAEQAAARQHQAGQASTEDGAGDAYRHVGEHEILIIVVEIRVRERQVLEANEGPNRD